MLAFLFGGMASACSMGDVGELLQERMESESVDTEESKQQAEPREAETKQLENQPAAREQISVGKYASEHLDEEGLF